MGVWEVTGVTGYVKRMYAPAASCARVPAKMPDGIIVTNGNTAAFASACTVSAATPADCAMIAATLISALLQPMMITPRDLRFSRVVRSGIGRAPLLAK